jgi:hypothetical protein
MRASLVNHLWGAQESTYHRAKGPHTSLRPYLAGPHNFRGRRPHWDLPDKYHENPLLQAATPTLYDVSLFEKKTPLTRDQKWTELFYASIH